MKPYLEGERAETIRTLAAANLANHVAALDHRNHIYVRRFNEGEFVRARDQGSSVHWCRLGGGVFNIIYGARLAKESASPEAGARVRDITRRTSVAWNEPVRWFVSSIDTPSRLGELLEDEGWSMGFRWTEMGMQLSRAGQEPASRDISITRVRDDSARRDWTTVQCAGYGLDGRLAEFMDRVSIAFLAQSRPRYRLYLAKATDNTPVAAAALFVQGTAAGVYMVATAPRYRRNGFATDLMRRVMADAARARCAACVLQSSAQAKSLYESLGFVATGETVIYQR